MWPKWRSFAFSLCLFQSLEEVDFDNGIYHGCVPTYAKSFNHIFCMTEQSTLTFISLVRNRRFKDHADRYCSSPTRHI
ncbi:hypothetical protein B0J14DRAFT_572252 [Halenospora varia]|nr:hypothetical protein B0J14DRAFT_572252 [Halenospora varia]